VSIAPAATTRWPTARSKSYVLAAVSRRASTRRLGHHQHHRCRSIPGHPARHGRPPTRGPAPVLRLRCPPSAHHGQSRRGLEDPPAIRLPRQHAHHRPAAATVPPPDHDPDVHPHEAAVGLLALVHSATTQELRHLTVSAVNPARQAVHLPGRPQPTPPDPWTWTAIERCLEHRHATGRRAVADCRVSRDMPLGRPGIRALP